MPSTFEGAGVQPGALQGSDANGAPDVAPAPAPEAAGPGERREAGLVVEELLVEDISIDGMCGVY